MPEPAALILLSEHDNVLVAARDFAAGEALQLPGAGAGSARLAAPLPMGHKVARRPIQPGEAVLKYGAPIGRATQAIAAFEHVHLHNVVSNYTRSHVVE